VSSDKPPDTVAAVDAEKLQAEATAAIAAVQTLDELDELRVRYLGRKSELKQALRNVRDRDTGAVLNTARVAVEDAVEARRGELESAKLERQLAEGAIDPTLPSDLLARLDGTEPTRLARPRGTLHPTTQIRRELEDIFIGLGYEVIDGREVETSYYNFDALNMPPWHPARSPIASLFIDDDTLLRTETSPAQIHKLESQPPPIYMVSLGRVYRRDTIDPTHYPIFHQVEGLAIDRNITMADLKGTLLYVMRELFGPERELRFRTHYFPFTEPSMEPDVSCFECGGAGCRICKYSGWIEMGGSGMVDPTVLENCNVDSEEWGGFAFGLGIERIAQLRYGIGDLRLFWENDLRFLRQFR
jgi:phenylalanyl-tRNA synthetase alpha chain